VEVLHAVLTAHSHSQLRVPFIPLNLRIYITYLVCCRAPLCESPVISALPLAVCMSVSLHRKSC